MKKELLLMLLATPLVYSQVCQITSGGQTGVDRAALDTGLELHIPIGGFCPKGRLAEDGTLDFKYPLVETLSSEYSERTLANILYSDGTLILYYGELMGGTALTEELAILHNKPYLLINLQDQIEPSVVFDWIQSHSIENLNIAGPRESTHPGVYEMAHAFLYKIFG